MASYLTKRHHCLEEEDGGNENALDERRPLIGRRKVTMMSSFKLHALVSGIYGMILVLLLVVLLTGNYVCNDHPCESNKPCKNHVRYVSDKSLDVFSIILSAIGVLWMVADTVYRRIIESRDDSSIFISSKYLTAGIVVFGFIGCLNYALFILYATTCCRTGRLHQQASDALAMVFVLTEVAYIINYSNSCVQRSYLFRRFGFMHLIVTDISLWLYKNIYRWEIDSYIYRNNCTEFSSVVLTVNILTDVCSVQFIFNSTAILCMMWKNIGLKIVPVINNQSRSRNYSLCKGSRIGLIFGSIFLNFTIFSMILTYHFILQKNMEKVDYNYGILRIILDISMIPCSIILYLNISKSASNISTMSISSYNSEELILLIFFVTYCLQKVYSGLSLIILKEIPNPFSGIRAVSIMSEILCNVKLVMQTLFILKVLRLKSFTIERPNVLCQVILFYFFLNVGWCIIALVDWKFSPHLDMTELFMFVDHWSVIKRITGPFVVGYYYHCSACLFEMWLHITNEIIVNSHHGAINSSR